MNREDKTGRLRARLMLLIRVAWRLRRQQRVWLVWKNDGWDVL